MKRDRLSQLFSAALALTLIMGTISFGYAGSSTITTNQGDSYEKPLPRNQILYSEIGSKLKEIKDKNSKIMDYQIIGQTNQGRDLYLVTLTDGDGMQNLQKHKDFMENAVKNPQAAMDYIKKNTDYKVPVFFNASIHGNETPGVDGVIKLIEKLTTDKSAEVQGILKNCVVLINVVQNPDGRASGVRENAAGVDMNRDYITQSQPETQAIVKNVATAWYPTTMLDLHGFMTTDNILLEPCTIPHNPNYEYDLLAKSLLPHAKYMAAAMKEATGWDVDIPAEIWDDGWDDYPPIFTPQYFMYFGTISHTLEIKYADQDSINADFAACYASLQYAAKNKATLMTNQFEIFNRGVQGIEVENDVDFPYAYIIPSNKEQQKDIYEAYEMVQHLLDNGIIVQQASAAFTAGGVKYPAGTFIVPMHQGLRGLANTMLWQGEDVTKLASQMYDISAYSFPLLNGFDAPAVQSEFNSETKNVTEVLAPVGSFNEGAGVNYIMPVENDAAYLVANTLVKEGFKVYRSKDMVSKYPSGTFVIPAQSGVAEKLKDLASKNMVNIVGIGETKATFQPLMLKKIAIVEEDGGTFSAMRELGFNVTEISYNAINHGYDLDKNGFQALVLSGSQGLWKDSYDASGTTWSLDSRGIENLVKFAKNHDYIGAGYAGAMLNQEIDKLDVVMDFIGEDDSQTAENGICTFDAKKSDPITYNYGKNEIIFAFKPMWVAAINNSQVVVSGSYGKGEDMYKAGFWAEPQQIAGAYAIVHDDTPDYDAVLFGIVPTFRYYNHATNGMMANAIYYLGYDGK
nr:M14 family zinc carboxypeptidase [uncultured Aminipila sp.]